MRITNKYRAGSGDNKEITEVFHIYGFIDEFQADLGEYIFNLRSIAKGNYFHREDEIDPIYKILDNNLMWLLGKLTQLGSWAYFIEKGKYEEASKYGFSVEESENLQQEIDELKPNISNCEDFYYFFIPEEVIINKVRVRVRHLEVLARELKQHKVNKEDITKDMINTLKFLNRLSEYFWVICKLFHDKNNSAKMYKDKMPQKLETLSTYYKKHK